MSGLLRWIDSLPLGVLAVVALLMALAPFSPEPHLVEKWKMLKAGTLRRPIDLFDVIWHLLPAALLGVKLARQARMP